MKFTGTWIMRNGRKVKFTEDVKEMLFDLGTFPLQLFSSAWDEKGDSKVDKAFDLMERIRDAKEVGNNL